MTRPLLFLAALLTAISVHAAGFTVVIDPGHGGADIPGKSDSTQEGDGASYNNATSASRRFLEKELTLSYGLAIKSALEKSERARALNIRVVMTRDRDVHLGALERAAVVSRESADVFLSIHFNTGGHAAEGTRAFFCSADHPAWEYMHFANPYEARDRRFAELVAETVANALQPYGGKPEKRLVQGDHIDRKDGIRMLGFARQDTHLHNAAIALLEVEFIDNPAVEAWLLGNGNREKTEKAVGEAAANAICAWLEKTPAERDVVEKARKARK